jgi:hypothetical protein
MWGPWIMTLPLKLDVHKKLIHQLTTLIHGLRLSILDGLINWSLSKNNDKFSRSSDLEIRHKLGQFEMQVSYALEGKIK